MTQPSGRKTRASIVSDTLRDAIICGDLAPGEKVNLDQLKERFAVSLSPLREAISRLVSEGMVVAEDQRGFRISDISSEDLAEVITLRCELEALALAQSIARANVEWEAQIMGALHRLQCTPRHGHSPDASNKWEEAHNHFHSVLLGGSAMPQLIRFCAILHGRCERYVRLFVSADEHNGRDNEKEHADLAEAAAGRDAALATALLRAHIRKTGDHLQAKLKQKHVV